MGIHLPSAQGPESDHAKPPGNSLVYSAAFPFNQPLISKDRIKRTAIGYPNFII